jgi:hypothetical protein
MLLAGTPTTSATRGQPSLNEAAQRHLTTVAAPAALDEHVGGKHRESVAIERLTHARKPS